MKLYYFKDPKGNFGDDLNPWLWQQLLCDIFHDDDADLFVGVGTLLNHRIPDAPAVTVFGSGHGYGELPKQHQHWTFYAVRGPLTAKAFGLAGELAITDPASLTPRYHQYSGPKVHKVSFMPHCESARLGDWAKVCALAGIHYIDPRQPFLQVFDAICQSELLLTEAMHGAILADSFRVPWVPVKAYRHISEYKWQDWLMSVGLKSQFNTLSPVWRGDNHLSTASRLKNQLKRGLRHTPLWQKSWGTPPPQASTSRQIEQTATELRQLCQAKAHLSTDAVFAANTERLLATVQRFKQDQGI